MKIPRYSDDPLAAAIGRIAILTEQVETLTNELRAATQTIDHQNHRITFLEEHQKQLTRPRTLLTIQEVAAMLDLSARTLKRWRDEPHPRIPFILMEGGDVRYRTEAIESYLKSRERGASRPALRAA